VAAYRDGYRIAGDIDELDFLSREDYLVIPSLADRLASQLHSVCLRTCLLTDICLSAVWTVG